MRVDVHGHYLPPRFFAEMYRLGAPQSIEAFSVYGPLLGPAADRLFGRGDAEFVDRMVSEMDGCGVDLTVVGLGALQPTFSDKSLAVSASRFANEMLEAAVALGRGRVLAFASVPLPHAAAAVAELERAVANPAFAGIGLPCSAAGTPLDDPAFADFWDAAEQHAATVFIHPGATPTMAVGSSDFHLAPDFCSPAEIAVAVSRLVVMKVVQSHPSVQIVVGSMGGSLPFQAHRFDRGLHQSHPDLYEELGGVVPQLRSLWYDSSPIEDAQALESVRATFGVDRLVFGSDVPRGPLAEAIAFIADSERLSAQERRLILDVNPATALGLDTPRSQEVHAHASHS